MSNENLVSASQDKNVDVVKKLLASGVDPNQEAYGNTPLNRALWSISIMEGKELDDCIIIVKELIAHGADVNRGRPLIMAAQNGYGDISRLLVNAGADLCDVDGDGCTALLQASQSNHIDIVKYLLDNGAKAVVNQARFDGTTALIIASNKGYDEVVRLLLEAGADRFKKRVDGVSARSLAYKCGHNRVVAYLDGEI